MIQIDYSSIPGFLSVMGGLIGFFLEKKSHISLTWYASIVLGISFCLGWMSDGVSNLSYPLSYPESIGGIMSLNLVFLLAIVGPSYPILMVAAGFAQLVFASQDIHNALIFTEVVSILSLALVIQNDENEKIYFIALRILALTCLVASFALVSADVAWMNPAYDFLSNYKVSLNDVASAFVATCLGIHCFFGPLSSFAARLYSKPCKNQEAKVLLFMILPVIAIIYLTHDLNLKLTFLIFSGLLSIFFSSIISLREGDKFKVLAYNLVSHLGVVQIAVGCGEYLLGIAYLSCISIPHIASVFYFSRNDGSLSNERKIIWRVLGFVSSVLPIILIPPYASYGQFRSISLAIGNDNLHQIISVAFIMHVGVNFISNVLRWFTGSSTAKPVNNRDFIKILGFMIAPMGYTFIGNPTFFSLTDMAFILQIFCGAILAYTVMRLINRHFYSPSFNVDHALAAGLIYIWGISSKFFLFSMHFVFDYTVGMIYNRANNLKKDVGCPVVSCILCLSSSLIGLGLWFFLIVR